MGVGGQPGGVGGVEGDDRVFDGDAEHAPAAKGHAGDLGDVFACVAGAVRVDVEPEVGIADREREGFVAKLRQGLARGVHVGVEVADQRGEVGGLEGDGVRVFRDGEAEDRKLGPVGLDAGLPAQLQGLFDAAEEPQAGEGEEVFVGGGGEGGEAGLGGRKAGAGDFLGDRLGGGGGGEEKGEGEGAHGGLHCSGECGGAPWRRRKVGKAVRWRTRGPGRGGGAWAGGWG